MQTARVRREWRKWHNKGKHCIPFFCVNDMQYIKISLMGLQFPSHYMNHECNHIAIKHPLVRTNILGFNC